MVNANELKINPRELRIGNIVYKKDTLYHGSGQPKITERLYTIDASDIYHIVKDGDPTNHPVFLTSKILEQCGFKQNSFFKREFQLYDTFEFVAVDHYEKGFLISCNFLQGGIITEHLHRLQNLYFSLIGTELKINL